MSYSHDQRGLPGWRARWPEWVAVTYLALVGIALVFTLRSLAVDDFDGLNNLFQLPLALPWVIAPLGGTDHVQNAYIFAGFGALNAVLLYLWLRRVRRRRGSRRMADSETKAS